MLTERQATLLNFLRERGEHSPSYDEMAAAIGVKAKSNAHTLVRQLEQRGFIKRLPNRARAIQVLEKPDIPEVYTPALRDIPIAHLKREMKRRGYVTVKFT